MPILIAGIFSVLLTLQALYCLFLVIAPGREGFRVGHPLGLPFKVLRRSETVWHRAHMHACPFFLLAIALALINIVVLVALAPYVCRHWLGNHCGRYVGPSGSCGFAVGEIELAAQSFLANF